MLRLFRFHSEFLRCCGIPNNQRSIRTVASYLPAPDSVEVDSKMSSPDFYQNVVVMRHGERMDNFEPLWASTASRPWDPPLFRDGWIRAQETGRTLRKSLGFPIHRVFVSPFLRCIQTASEVVTALCAVHDDPSPLSSHAISIDASKVKVSVEYGLCEMMNSKGIRPGVAPKDGNFSIDISQCEAMLPAGTVDDKAERLYKELPKWEEPASSTRARYEQVFKDLANKHPTENLLLITHGEGVGVALSAFKKDAQVSQIEYCAYVKLRRPVFQKDQSFTAGEFKALNLSGQSGITYSLPNASTNHINEV
ncbi:uncharacterized protein LOC129290478 [Prosopis cineraria]|uniref:uncharacterized protein LOC129290478 n=1 Tax=Prosopis cineraria TaxID=364024 RepID=UPI00240EE876|nr:uncharacterized protein LOC129290478 [Prosopis cineraria]